MQYNNVEISSKTSTLSLDLKFLIHKVSYSSPQISTLKAIKLRPLEFCLICEELRTVKVKVN